MLYSTEHKIPIAHKKQYAYKAFQPSDFVFIMLINVKTTIVCILTSMSMVNFMFSLVKHEQSFITSGPGHKSSPMSTSSSGEIKVSR